MNSHKTQDDPTQRIITRRRVITAGGAALVGATLVGPLAGAALGQATGGQESTLRSPTTCVVRR